MKSKDEVAIGDIIHIYHIFGDPCAKDYRDIEGTVTYIDDMDQIHGTWDGIALLFNDDWEIVS